MNNSKSFTKKDAVIINSGLDWIGRMFRPELCELWKKDPDGYYVSTLTSYYAGLEKFLPHLPAKKVIELKKAIDDFLKTQKKFKEARLIAVRIYYNYFMNGKSKIVFNKTSELLVDKNQEKYTLVNY